MATTTEEIAVDIDALDAEAAKKAVDPSKTNGAEEPLKVETTDTPDKAVVTPEEGLKKLQKQLADEKSARLAAEARANEAAQGEAKARGDVQTTQLDLVKGAIERVTQSSDALEAKYAEAAAAQDWATVAKVQREMAKNAADLAQLEAGKSALEKAPKPTPRIAADPVDQFCASLSAPSAAWVRAHPDFARDQQKTRQMIAAHELAIARGYKADTPEYFGSIEKTLDLSELPTKATPKPAEQDDDPMADAAQPAQRVAPAAAPVSRSGNGGGGRPNIVKLSPAEVEIATSMGMTPQEYAREKIALKKEGKLQ